MTISSTTRVNGPYTSGTALPFTFKVFAAADLDVIRLNTTTGVETVLVLNSDYTVALNGNQNTNPGGTVNLTVAASATSTVTITSDIANLQPTDLTNQGGFYPEVVTDSLDRATIQIQQLADGLNRSIKIPVSDGIASADLPVISQRAGKYLAFDASGQPIASAGSGTDTALRSDLAASNGSSLVGFVNSQSGATARTVQSKLRDAIHVKDFGAIGDGVADDRAAIQNAINAAAATQTGIVELDAATYAIGASLTMPSCVSLIGQGGGQYPASAFITSPNFTGLAKTRIVALSGFAANTPMISLATSAGSALCKQGICIRGIMLDCGGTIADRGIDAVALKHCHFNDILIFRPASIGVLEDCLAFGDVTETNGATQFCTWTGITVWAADSGSAAIGWRQTGNNAHNVNQNLYQRVMIVHRDGTGLDIVNADTQTYDSVSTYAFGQGYGCVLHGSDAATPAAYARRNNFWNCLFGGANVNYGTAQAGSTSNTVVLKSTAPSTNSIYNGKSITITGGTGSGQKRTISAYVGSTKTATVSANWLITPDATSSYQIDGCGGVLVKTGISEPPSGIATAQAGSSTSITLRAAASSITNAYVGQTITLTAGTGSGQSAAISAYNGTTKVATISGTFATPPDATTQYRIDGEASFGHVAHGYQEVGNGGKDPVIEAGASFSFKDGRTETFNDTVFGTVNISTARSFTGTAPAGYAGQLNFQGTAGSGPNENFGRVSLLMQGNGDTSPSGRMDFWTYQGKHVGTATAGGASTITLGAGYSNVQNAYVGQTIYLTGGTGAGQNRVITAFVTGTGVATVNTAWTTPPDATTTYEILGTLASRGYFAQGFVVDDIDPTTLVVADKGQGTISVRNGFYIQNTAILTGTGVPTVTAPSGSIFLRTDGGAGTTLYVREGATWTAK